MSADVSSDKFDHERHFNFKQIADKEENLDQKRTFCDEKSDKYMEDTVNNDNEISKCHGKFEDRICDSNTEIVTKYEQDSVSIGEGKDDGDGVADDDTAVLHQLEEDLLKVRVIVDTCTTSLLHALNFTTYSQKRLRKSVLGKLATLKKNIGNILDDLSNGEPPRKRRRRPNHSFKNNLYLTSADDLGEVNVKPEDIALSEKDMDNDMSGASLDRLKTEEDDHFIGDDSEEAANFDANTEAQDVDAEDNFICDDVSEQSQHSRSTRKVKKKKKYEKVVKYRNCEDCGKMIPVNTLVRHKVSHHKPVNCDICGQLFPGNKLLCQHKAREHEKRFIHMCDLCGYRTYHNLHLKRHREAKHEAWKYTCEWCSKLFSSAEGLTHHIRTHTGERPYPCDQCDKAFKQGSQLKRHKMTHTDLKPFACEICGKSFNQKGNMKTHMKSHIKSEWK